MEFSEPHLLLVAQSFSELLKAGFSTLSLLKNDSGNAECPYATLDITPILFCMLPRYVALSPASCNRLHWSMIKLIIDIRTVVILPVTTEVLPRTCGLDYKRVFFGWGWLWWFEAANLFFLKVLHQQTSQLGIILLWTGTTKAFCIFI